MAGPTGAGKTSLAYLIPGFYQPTEGHVRLDGRNILDIDVASLRAEVSYVFQEHLLLNESIRGNLLLEADIHDACDAAGASEFIDRLPDGLDTRLGQSGDTLSVGQKQRLCIARGLIRNTRILILDEPTAALDPQTENALVRALRRATEGRLVIVIAHRLSTVRQADRIVFLDNGEIREVGTHEGMMADPASPYRRFVELQGSTSA
ncbi:MAG: ABC transporter ATP-binding protein [Pseudomonadales bacterium]|nr:ABC transporter ATP-binding protein [Pseudomonadales bacterium]